MIDQKGTDSMATKLSQTRMFLREDFESINPDLPSLLRVLQSRGAGECWHKHGTFYEHLLHVYRILKLWGCPESVCLFGLFHSSYSNSYVNLAIFAPNVDRQIVRDLIGEEAEELVHVFCIVPRQELIFDYLLNKVSDQELTETLDSFDPVLEKDSRSDVAGQRESMSNTVHDHLVYKMGKLFRSGEGVEHAGADGSNGKRKSLVPTEGVVVKHIRTGEDVVVPRRLVAIFLLLTMADFVDQLYGWQVMRQFREKKVVVKDRTSAEQFLEQKDKDALFKNDDGKLGYRGNEWHALWPGDCKPGLWMNAVSRMGVLLNILLKEEHAEDKEDIQPRKMKSSRLFSNIDVPLPPVFDNCTVILPPEDQNRSRDLYWEALHFTERDRIVNTGEPLLQSACKLNPYTAEPHLLLAQIHLSEENYDVAEKEASEGLRLLLDWATCWDKRMTWEGWMAWARILLQNARDKTWPRDGFGILGLGLVQ